MNATTKILIVDDESTLTCMLERLLSRFGYRTAVAADGSAALSQVAAFRPDLVLSDLVMPVLDGLQLLACLRSSRRYRRIPVILMSSKDTAFAPLSRHDLQPDGFLAKPFTIEQLVGAIVRTLGSRKKGSK